MGTRLAQECQRLGREHGADGHDPPGAGSPSHRSAFRTGAEGTTSRGVWAKSSVEYAVSTGADASPATCSRYAGGTTWRSLAAAMRR
jgi:hypothetical protein